MPDPPFTFNPDHVVQSDTNNSRSRPPLQEAVSTPRSIGSSPSTSEETARQETSGSGSNVASAYAANPSSDIGISNNAFVSGSASITHHADATASASYSLHHDPANAQPVPNLNLASFGSQPWPTTSGPYLDFARQPIYEPAGELVHEAIKGFEHFDDPYSFRQVAWPPERESNAATPQLGKSSPNSLGRPSGVNRDAQNFPKPALKRPFESGTSGNGQDEGDQQPKQIDPRKLRRVSFEQMSGTGLVSADDEDSSSSEAPSTSRAATGKSFPGAGRRGRGARSGNVPPSRPATQQAAGAQAPGNSVRGNRNPSSHSTPLLPPEKVFPIQIGSELFRLSGASISSDAPSYFTQFFEEQIRQNEEFGGVRTLYIDRDPETFRDVARHLQGYFVKPRDGSHFVKLFADAQFYSLPRLIDQLFEAEIFIQIGEKHFQIPKDIFSDPGNSPNFFSLGFAVFFSTPGEVFPGLDRRGLLRPPSITPPYVPGRSAETFTQILHLLRGYPLKIKDEEHRAELLRDCRYFHLRGLEQKIIAHSISYNLERQQKEICLCIEDIKPSGISYKADEADNDQETTGGWVRYMRPFVDDESYNLIVEIGGECTVLDLDEMRVDFHSLAKARVSSLFQVVANKMNLPTNAPFGAMMLSGAGSTSHASPGHTPLSEDRVKIRFEPASDITLDGLPYDIDWNSTLGQRMRHGPNKSGDDGGNSDAMDDDGNVEQQPPQRPRARAGQSTQSQMASTRPGSSALHQAGVTASLPRIDTTSSSASRKRRRPTLSSEGSGLGKWVVRTAQWRLRIQQNKEDSIRGGYEIAFIAVKIDAFSQERARNARRKFLSNG